MHSLGRRARSMCPSALPTIDAANTLCHQEPCSSCRPGSTWSTGIYLLLLALRKEHWRMLLALPIRIASDRSCNFLRPFSKLNTALSTIPEYSLDGFALHASSTAYRFAGVLFDRLVRARLPFGGVGLHLGPRDRLACIDNRSKAIIPSTSTRMSSTPTNAGMPSNTSVPDGVYLCTLSSLSTAF